MPNSTLPRVNPDEIIAEKGWGWGDRRGPDA